jgi:hypothetical protein
MRGAVVVILGLSGLAHASTVRGTIALPPEPRAADTRDGHWRVENGVLPIAPRTADSRSELIVVLEGPNAHAKPDAPPPQQVVVDLHGVRLDPKVVLAPMGATVVFRNDDRVPHTLYLEHATSLMPAAPTPAGQARSVKFLAAGEYPVRDEEFPHVEATIVVVQSPLATQPDDKNNFKLDAPEGHYTLKVFWRNAWVVEQPLDVGSSRTTEVSIQVPPPAARSAPEKRGE